MQQERWKQIETILDTALTLSGEEQTNFVIDACGNDKELLTEVYEILEAIEESEKTNFLDSVHSDNKLFVEEVSDYQDSYVGMKVGAFKITDKLGSGGMGAVYKAERADGQFAQQVAIKLLQKGIQSEETLRRFHMEQEILASLKHPNIAQLYDGGVTEDGVSYLVMEYVDGMPIDRYCNEHRLTVEERIKLFKDVCKAVQFAHSSLVIHRDLKAQNIYVTSEGDVKILDFGIAKLLDPKFTEQTLLETRPGQKFWTPQYAAPEQVKGEAITTATDVYALGVLLYKLLTDDYPLDLKDKVLAEVESLIIEASPAAPSQSIEEAPNPDQRAKLHHTTPAELKKALTGDLDAVVLKALRKEPRYRYNSTGQLLEDLQRYQNGLPIIARKDTLRYRTGKFIRRNKTILTTVSFLSVLIVGFSLFYAVQINKEKTIAESEAQKAQEIKQFLLSLFNASNPQFPEVDGDTLLAKDLLERGLVSISDYSISDRQVLIELLRTIGKAYTEMGLYEKAEVPLDSSLKLSVAIHGVDSPNAIDNYLDQVKLSIKKNEFTRADSILEKAHTIISQHGLNSQKVAADVLAHQGLIAGYLTKYEKAKILYQQALAIYKDLGLENSLDAIDTKSNLADVNTYLGELQEAERTQLQILDYYATHFGENHIKVAATLGTLVSIYRRQSKFKKALETNKKTIKIRRSIFGENHDEVAQSYSNRAIILQITGSYDSAEDFIRMALDIYAQSSSQSLEYAFALNNLAVIKKFQREFETALQHFEEVLGLFKLLLGREASAVAVTTYNLADLHIAMGNYNQALPLLKEVVRIDRKNLGNSHTEVGVDLKKLAEIHRQVGQFDQAEIYFNESKKILFDNLSPSHYRIGEWYVEYGRLLLDQNKLAQAEKHLNKAQKIQKENFEDNDTRIAKTYFYLGNIYRLMENHARADRYYQSSWGIVKDKSEKEVAFMNPLKNQLNSQKLKSN